MPKHHYKRGSTAPSRAMLKAGPIETEFETHNEPVTEQDIREWAYQLWEDAGMPPGDGVDFWLAAERELKGNNGAMDH